MNVLLVSPCSPRESIGGVERYIQNLIYCFKNQTDHHVKLMLPTSASDSVEENGTVKIFFERSMSITAKMSSVEISRRARIFADSVERIIKEENIDIICAENFHIGFPAAYSILLNMTAAIHKVPLVLRLHSFATSELQRELINQLMWEKISCVSFSVAGDCFTKGADVNTLSTDYLGVNTMAFNTVKQKTDLRKQLGLKAGDKIILTASRIITGKKETLREKGLINLIEAFAKISPRHDNLKLLIAVGRPPEILHAEFDDALQKLNGYTKLRGVYEKTIVKVFSLDEMPNVYREADLFVLASENETFGQVFIESMACGLPVIGTKVGGIPEIIRDSFSGYLIPPRDATILAQKIESILSDSKLSRKFADAGLKAIQEKFTLEKQFSKFMNTLTTLTATK